MALELVPKLDIEASDPLVTAVMLVVRTFPCVFLSFFETRLEFRTVEIGDPTGSI